MLNLAFFFMAGSCSYLTCPVIIFPLPSISFRHFSKAYKAVSNGRLLVILNFYIGLLGPVRYGSRLRPLIKLYFIESTNTHL